MGGRSRWQVGEDRRDLEVDLGAGWVQEGRVRGLAEAREGGCGYCDECLAIIGQNFDDLIANRPGQDSGSTFRKFYFVTQQ